MYTLAAMGTGLLRYSKERCGAALEGSVQLCWLSEQTPPLFILGQREILTGFVLGLFFTYKQLRHFLEFKLYRHYELLD